MIKYEMTAQMRKVTKLRRSYHPNGMLMRMFPEEDCIRLFKDSDSSDNFDGL